MVRGGAYPDCVPLIPLLIIFLFLCLFLLSPSLDPNSSDTLDGLIRGQRLGFGRLSSTVYEGMYNQRLVAVKVRSILVLFPHALHALTLSPSFLSILPVLPRSTK